MPSLGVRSPWISHRKCDDALIKASVQQSLVVDKSSFNSDINKKNDLQKEIKSALQNDIHRLYPLWESKSKN